MSISPLLRGGEEKGAEDKVTGEANLCTLNFYTLETNPSSEPVGVRAVSCMLLSGSVCAYLSLPPQLAKFRLKYEFQYPLQKTI